MSDHVGGLLDARDAHGRHTSRQWTPRTRSGQAMIGWSEGVRLQPPLRRDVSRIESWALVRLRRQGRTRASRTGGPEGASPDGGGRRAGDARSAIAMASRIRGVTRAHGNRRMPRRRGARAPCAHDTPRAAARATSTSTGPDEPASSTCGRCCSAIAGADARAAERGRQLGRRSSSVGSLPSSDSRELEYRRAADRRPHPPARRDGDVCWTSIEPFLRDRRGKRTRSGSPTASWRPFSFTDIVELDGAAWRSSETAGWRELLERHHAIVRAQLARARGARGGHRRRRLLRGVRRAGASRPLRQGDRRRRARARHRRPLRAAHRRVRAAWTGRSRGSPSTPAPGWHHTPGPARCSSRARSRTSSQDRGSSSRTAASTSSRACRASGGSTPPSEPRRRASRSRSAPRTRARPLAPTRRPRPGARRAARASPPFAGSTSSCERDEVEAVGGEDLLQPRVVLGRGRVEAVRPVRRRAHGRGRRSRSARRARAARRSPRRAGRCSSSGRSRAGATTTTRGARDELERDLRAPVERELGRRRVVAAVRDAEDRQRRLEERGGRVAVGLPLPHLRGRDDGEVALDMDGVRRHDDRDVGSGGVEPPSELLHRRAQLGREVDVAVRRDAGEGEAHGSESIRETSSSRNRSASTSTPTSAFGSRPVTPRRSTTVRPSQSSERVSIATFARTRRQQRRVDDVCDGHRIVDRRAVEAVRALVERLEEVRQLGDEAAGAAGSTQPLGVRAREQRLVRDVEPDHRDRDPAREDRAPPPRDRRRR